MRILVVLAVMGVWSTSAHQAYNHGVGGYGGSHALAAANEAFSAAYQKQLALVTGGGGYQGGHHGMGHHGSGHLGVTSHHHGGHYTGSHGYHGGSHAHGGDTPAVAAAKANFFKLYNEQAAKAAAAPDDHYSGHHHSGAYNSGGHHGGSYHGGGHHHAGGHQGGSYHAGGHTGDTPAVAAAKAQFFSLYNKLAAASAAAPDHYGHGYH